MIQITSFLVNGRKRVAVSDSGDLRVSLYVNGPAEEVQLILCRGTETLWESGIIAWKPHLQLENLPLKPCGSYRLIAEVTGAGETAQEEITLRTGMMDKPWKACWIEPEQEMPVKERPIQFFEQFVPMPDHFGGHGRLKPVQELHRVFELDRLPEQATLCASAHGVYALWLNGKRVDARRLAPETTCYESLLYYQVYDLSGLLQQGKNTLRVLLGDGWWIGRVGITGDSCQYGDRLAFLAQLELNYEDGSTETICTDGKFLSRESHIKYSDLFMGEKWDLTAQIGEWIPCKTAGAADDTLAIQKMDPVSVWTVLEPVALLTTPGGELVADFGQCLAGVVELSRRHRDHSRPQRNPGCRGELLPQHPWQKQRPAGHADLRSGRDLFLSRIYLPRIPLCSYSGSEERRDFLYSGHGNWNRASGVRLFYLFG